MLLKHIKSYLNNTAGNFGVAFSITLIPILLGVGSAVDYANLTNSQSELQTMADSAALIAVSTSEYDEDSLERLKVQSIQCSHLVKPIYLAG